MKFKIKEQNKRHVGGPTAIKGFIHLKYQIQKHLSKLMRVSLKLVKIPIHISITRSYNGILHAGHLYFFTFSKQTWQTLASTISSDRASPKPKADFRLVMFFF